MPRLNRGGHGFTGQRVEYDHQGTERVDPTAQADLAMTKRIASTLERHYPGHAWKVMVTHRGGVAQIALPILMKPHEGFVLHLSNLYSDPGLKAVVRAGGDILERYKMPRQAFDLDHFLTARSTSLFGRKPTPRLLVPDTTPQAPRQKLFIPGQAPEGPRPRLILQ
jgi:hypothetical protein